MVLLSARGLHEVLENKAISYRYIYIYIYTTAADIIATRRIDQNAKRNSVAATTTTTTEAKKIYATYSGIFRLLHCV